MEACSEVVREWTLAGKSVALNKQHTHFTATVTDRTSQQRWTIPSANIHFNGWQPPAPLTQLKQVLANTSITLQPSGTSLALHIHQGKGTQSATEEKQVTFTVSAQKITCSLAPLLQSEYFLALLTGGMQEAEADEIEIQGVTYETFRRLLEYLVKGQLFPHLELSEKIDLAYAANQFQVHALGAHIEADLSSQADTVVKKLLGLMAQDPYYGVQRPNMQSQELIALEKELLTIWEFAQALDRQPLLKTCTPKRDVPDNSQRQRNYQQIQPMPDGAKWEMTTGGEVCFHFSYLALGTAVATGCVHILPKLTTSTCKQSSNSYGQPELYPAIELCFLAKSGSDYHVPQRSGPIPVKTAIKAGHVESIRWLAKNDKAMQHFTLEHLECAASHKQLSCAGLVLTALTTRPPTTILPVKPAQGMMAAVRAAEPGQPLPGTCSDRDLRRTIDKLLTLAYQEKSRERLKHFLTAGKSLFQRGSPPALFFELARQGDVEWMELLWGGIEIDPEAADGAKDRAVHHAAARKQFAMLSWLVKRRASLEGRDRHGNTPLHIALYKKELNTALFLLKTGAPLSPSGTKSSQPRASLPSSLHPGQRGIRRTAAAQYDDDLWDEPETPASALQGPISDNDLRLAIETLLLDCYGKGEKDSSSTLLTGCKRLFSPNSPPSLYIKVASDGEMEWMERVWKDIKVDVTATNSDHQSALHLAVKRKQLVMIKWLIGKGAPTDQKDKEGNTPLHAGTLACTKTDTRVLESLLTGKGNLNGAGKGAQTPLHLAMLGRNLKASILLVQHGASVVPKLNASKEWPCDIPAASGDKTFVLQFFQGLVKLNIQKAKDEALIWSGFRLGSEPKGAYYDLIAFLVTSGANVNTVNHKKETPLHYAAHHGLSKACAYLLAHQATIDPLDQAKQTPLHRAAYGGHFEVVKQLIEAKAAVEVWDKNGYTPYQLAHQQRQGSARYEDYSKVIALLEGQSCAIQ